MSIKDSPQEDGTVTQEDGAVMQESDNTEPTADPVSVEDREEAIESMASQIVEQMLSPPPVTEEERKATLHAIAGASHVLLENGQFFLAHLNLGLVRQITNEIPTAAVGIVPDGAQNITLLVNPRFFMSAQGGAAHRGRANQRAGIIMHELLHILLRHIQGSNWTGKNTKLWNYALDMAVNQLIPFDLPGEPIRHDMEALAHLQLPPGKTSEFYYNALLADPQQTMQQEGGEFNTMDCHDFMKGLSPAEQTLLDEKIKSIINRIKQADITGKIWSSLPGNLGEELATWIKITPPQISWRAVLRAFASSHRSSHIRGTNAKKSKRFGTIPGIRMKRMQHILVIVDTSGSMSDVAISLCFSEIDDMHRNGAKVVVLESDAQVQRSYPYSGRPPSGVAGRGGTVFNPAIAWANDHNEKWNGIIYLTDGYACPLTIRPQSPILWVVTADGHIDPNTLTYGRIVQMDHN